MRLTDNFNDSFTNIWSFTAGHGSLPFTMPGPFTVSQTTGDLTIIGAGDAWLGTNYQDNIGKATTLFYRFSEDFVTLDNTNDDGQSDGTAINTWGGLETYNNNTEVLGIGNSGPDAYWSTFGALPDEELTPLTLITTNDWHTIAVEIQFDPGGADNITIWLNPDFSQTNVNQPNANTYSFNASVYSVRLRAGFLATTASFSNIVFGVQATDIGFAAPASPMFQNLVPANGANGVSAATSIGGQIVVGTVGILTNDITLLLNGAAVTPSFTISGNNITLSYQPGAPFVGLSSHTAEIELTDTNGDPYSTSWSFTVGQPTQITFSGYTWNTVPASFGNYGPDQTYAANNYAATATNTGVIYALYNANNAIVTAVTVGAGYTASFDLYLSDSSPGEETSGDTGVATWATDMYGFGDAWGGNFVGTWTSQFIDGTTIGGNNDATYRTISETGLQGSGDTGHYDLAVNDGTGPQGADTDWFTVSEDLSTGVNFFYTFGLNSYTITATALANSSETLTETFSYEDGNVNSIQGFVTGMYNSEETSTISDFTIIPPASAPVLSEQSFRWKHHPLLDRNRNPVGSNESSRPLGDCNQRHTSLLGADDEPGDILSSGAINGMKKTTKENKEIK